LLSLTAGCGESTSPSGDGNASKPKPEKPHVPDAVGLDASSATDDVNAATFSPYLEGEPRLGDESECSVVDQYPAGGRAAAEED
jgi:hypothetical protein